MLFDGVSLIEGTTLTNAALPSGTSFPTGSTGELFFRTDENKLYVYTGSAWNEVGTGGTVDFSSLNVKAAVRAATTGNITLSGTQTIDGVAVVAGNRVLVKNQSTGSQNGIYVVAAGAWSRATDFDGAPTGEVEAGDFVFVTEGSTNADTGWVLTTNDPITVGTTSLTWSQFTGSAGATLASTQVGFGSAGNLLTGSADFTFASGTNTLSLGSSTTPGEFRGWFSGTGTLFRTLDANTATTVRIAPNGTNNTSQIILYGNSNGSSSAVTMQNFGGALSITAANATTISGGGGSSMLNIGASDGGIWLGGGSVLAANATGPFFYLANINGTPTGTPTQSPTSTFNRSPIVIDQVNNLFYYYVNGAWRTPGGTATNISGGSTDQIPYQSAANTTSFSSDFTWSNSSRTLTLSQATQGGTVTIQGGGAGGTPRSFVITAGAGNTGNNGSSLTLQGGGAGASSSIGGNLTLSGGVGTGTTVGGAIILQTTANATQVERLRILNNGAWSVGTGGSATGTSGQVLTSNGASSPPTWQNSISGTNISWDNTSSTLALGGTSGLTASTIKQSDSSANGTPPATLTIAGGNATNGNTNGGAITIQGGSGFRTSTNASSGLVSILGAPSTFTQINGGDVLIAGGTNTNTTNGIAGGVTVQGGDATANTVSSGGNLTLQGGRGGATGTGGYIRFITASPNTLTERFRILANGAWSVGSAGSNTGSSGQVLTSNGGTTPPTWQTFSASPLPNATTLGTTANSAVTLTGVAATTSASAPMTLIASTTSTGTGNSLTLQGGGTTSGSTAPGGSVIIAGGIGSAAGTPVNGPTITVPGGAGAGGTIAITGQTGSGNNAGSPITITAGSASGNGSGGAITLTAGSATQTTGSTAGSITLTAGFSGNSVNPGGNVNIAAGDANKGTSPSGNGGNVNITAGTSTFGTGGYVSVRTGTAAFAERLRVKENGAVRYVPMAQPSSAEAGDVYFDSTTNKLRCYDGTIWNDLF